MDTIALDQAIKEICTRQVEESLEVLTTAEVSKILKISKKQVWNLSMKGQIPAFRIGNLWRFNKLEILKLVQHGRQPR